MEYIGQVFGNREVIREKCYPEDWESLGLRVPDRIDKYKLGKCLSCGTVLPTMTKNLTQYPPKRCMYCSNIGNHFKVQTNTNSWTVYEEYAVCNILYDSKIVSCYIDIEDYDRAKQIVWRISKKRNKFYVISGSYKKHTMRYMHEFVYGERPSGMEIDHIDGNSLNNRRNNLRIVTRQCNIDNQRATRIDNQIGIRGVSYSNRDKNYRVDFNYHGRRFYTHSWKTIEEAVWCRYCFEDYFELPSIKSNPLASQYYTLSEERCEEIHQYVLETILGNER